MKVEAKSVINFQKYKKKMPKKKNPQNPQTL